MPRRSAREAVRGGARGGRARAREAPGRRLRRVRRASPRGGVARAGASREAPRWARGGRQGAVSRHRGHHPHRSRQHAPGVPGVRALRSPAAGAAAPADGAHDPPLLRARLRARGGLRGARARALRRRSAREDPRDPPRVEQPAGARDGARLGDQDHREREARGLRPRPGGRAAGPDARLRAHDPGRGLLPGRPAPGQPARHGLGAGGGARLRSLEGAARGLRARALRADVLADDVQRAGDGPRLPGAGLPTRRAETRAPSSTWRDAW